MTGGNRNAQVILWLACAVASGYLGILLGLRIHALLGVVGGLVAGIAVGSASVAGAKPTVAEDAAARVPLSTVVRAILLVGLMVGSIAGASGIGLMRWLKPAGIQVNLPLVALVLVLMVGVARMMPLVSYLLGAIAAAFACAAAIPHLNGPWADSPLPHLCSAAVVGGCVAAFLGAAEATAKYTSCAKRSTPEQEPSPPKPFP